MNYQIEIAKIVDIKNIVNLHTQCFPGFFLTQLGTSFLHLFYKHFIISELGYLIIIKSENITIGFLAGTVNVKDFFTKFKKQYFFSLLSKIIIPTIKNPIFFIQKIYYGLFYKGSKIAPPNNSALLSSIAVSSIVRGKGAANLLLDSYIKHCIKKNKSSIYLTTDADNNSNVNSFYLRNKFTLIGDFFQNKSRRMNHYERTI